MAKVLRINMTNRTARFEEVPDKYATMGGRWLTSSVVSDEVSPLCHALGEENKVVVAPGIVTGTAAPTSGRVSVGAKSPLTGTIKESNAGTSFGQRLARLGIQAIVVEGKPKEKGGFWLVRITKDGVAFVPADAWLGQGLYAAVPSILKQQKSVGHAAVLAIGTAGEQLMAAAGVSFTDVSGQPSRYAGRGGLGAVLGCKGLKAIVVDDTGAPERGLANRSLFDEGRKKLARALAEHAITKPKGALNTYGTAVLVNIINEAGGLPTRNFRDGRFEGASKISGEAIFARNKDRLGTELYNHACNPGCVIQCSNTLHRPDKSIQTSCLEYESAWALGANCGIDDLDTVAELNQMCNDYGLDTIEIGGTIAVAMEGGLARFGDGARAIELLHEIGTGTPLGRMLGSGAAVTGKVFGVERVPAVKGQNMPAYDPRAIKGIGMIYATSTMGADHTAGYTIAPEILGVSGKLDPLDSRKADLARTYQHVTAFLDSTGHCLFIAFAILDIAEGFTGVIDECNGVLGTHWTGDDAARIGRDIIAMERRFNKGAGFTEAHDRLPQFMSREPLPPHNAVWDVTDSDLDRVHGS